MPKSGHKKSNAEGLRMRARSHYVLPVADFGHNSLVSFRARFWPPNFRAKSENDQTEIGKRPGRNRKTAMRIFRKCYSKNPEVNIFCVENRPRFGPKTDQKLWPKIGQTCGRKSAKVFSRNMVSKPLQTQLQDTLFGSL